MKLKVKNFYGIRGEKEILFDSKGKNNIVIFAPNGVGKTSIYKGFDDIKNNLEYKGQEGYLYNSLFEFESDNLKINYKSKNKSVANILLIDHKFKSLYQPKLFDIITNEEKDKINSSSEKIINFSTEISSSLEKNINLNIDTNDYMEIVKKYDELLEKNFEDIDTIDEDINFYEKILFDINEILSNKKIQQRTIGEYYALSSGSHNEITIEQIINVKIINDIKSQKKENVNDFGFKKTYEEVINNCEYVPISEIRKDYLEINDKFSKEEINLLVSIRNMDEFLIPRRKNSNEYDKSKGKLISFVKNLERKIEEKYKNKMSFLIKEKKDEWNKIKDENDKINKNAIARINNLIKNLNNLLNNKMLDWKINFKEIKSINEDLKYIGYDDNDITHDNFEKNFEEYASEGQKKIIYILAQMVHLVNKKGVVILDDAMTSFDNQHIDELFQALGHDVFKNVRFLILTHNFELVRSLSFHRTMNLNSKLFLFDKIKVENYKIIEGDFKDIRDIMAINKINNNTSKKEKNYLKLIAISTLLRETIANILLVKTFPIKGISKDYKKEIELMEESSVNLVKLVEFIDQNFRHYKKNVKISSLIDKFKNDFYKNLKENIPVIKEIENILEKIYENEDSVLGDKIINQKINWDKINSFEEFILSKIFFGVQIRFKAERKKYYSEENEEVIKYWESEEEWNLANKKLENNFKNTFSANFLAHVNNIQWSKIIEYPIYKLLKMDENLEND